MEDPMVVVLALVLAAQDGSQKNVDTVVKAVEWQTSWDEVLKSAGESNKAVFWLNIVGDLDGST
jgi:hypothetical protein